MTHCTAVCRLAPSGRSLLVLLLVLCVACGVEEHRLWGRRGGSHTLKCICGFILSPFLHAEPCLGGLKRGIGFTVPESIFPYSFY